ncbi:hypothetical protein [Chlamydia vaughanii]|uniref:hypothetical protein n=1 Tax=Chlamydia vaughanii TaxID=3112552 RepID=UPI0032B111BB
MLIRLFFGIPLVKGMDINPQPPLTVATFQRKEYLGIYSPQGGSIFVKELDSYYRLAQELLEQVISDKHLTDREATLVVFPEILIGQPV